MATFQDVITRARYFINDYIAPLRQSDAELELYLTDAFGALYRVRPDVFPTGADPCNFSPPEWGSLTETLPVSSQWVRALAYYVAASAEVKDDEHVEGGRSVFFFQMASRAMGVD